MGTCPFLAQTKARTLPRIILCLVIVVYGASLMQALTVAQHQQRPLCVPHLDYTEVVVACIGSLRHIFWSRSELESSFDSLNTHFRVIGGASSCMNFPNLWRSPLTSVVHLSAIQNAAHCRFDCAEGIGSERELR
jgi:hypothetical protein